MVIKNWSIFFFAICTLTITRIIVSLVTDLYLKDYFHGERYFYISLLISSIFYIKVLTTPEILYGYNFFSDKVEEQRNVELILKKIWIFERGLVITNLQDIELNKKNFNKISLYISAIESKAIKNTIFRKECITISEFAKEVAIPKSHLVFIFKYHSKISFVAFKKIVKILDAVSLIESNFLNTNTLEFLAKTVGFSSYSTFFTSFKEITGVTPRSYCQEYAQKITIQAKLS